MPSKQAKAEVSPVRQRTQYSCMSCSMMMCLRALGVDCDEEEVNDVMGARPMRGASWESALACGQHYGMRCTLTVPTTIRQLKEWTDRKIPVMIAWNPEGRAWSHASVVFDVDDDLTVHVADPNIPDPDETVRIVPKGEFYKLWFEKFPNYLVRRPAMAIEREISEDGRQMVASKRASSETQAAVSAYAQAITDLEASADQVVVATNRLRSLGLSLTEESYPFAESIDVVASDIYRWRGAVDQRAAFVGRSTTRLASRWLHNKRG